MIASCDLCGKEKKIVKAKVEGTTLNVCENCAEFGEIIEIPKEVIKEVKQKNKSIMEEEVIEYLSNDYSKKIKQAREKINLKQEELAKRLAIKESLIHKFESGRQEPDLNTARKLENFLKIKLIEKYKEKYEKKTSKGSDSFTIGDIISKK